MEYEMDQECSTHGEMRNSYKIVEGKPEGKRPILGHLDVDRLTILKLVAENRL
jgi:cell wall assembly regulator SMI1